MSTSKHTISLDRHLLTALVGPATTDRVSVPTFVSEAFCKAVDRDPLPRPIFQKSRVSVYRASRGDRGTPARYRLQVWLPVGVMALLDVGALQHRRTLAVHIDQVLETARARWAAEHPHGVAPPRPSRREPLRLAQRLASLEASAGPLPAALALLNQRVEALEEALSKK